MARLRACGMLRRCRPDRNRKYTICGWRTTRNVIVGNRLESAVLHCPIYRRFRGERNDLNEAH